MALEAAQEASGEDPEAPEADQETSGEDQAGEEGPEETLTRDLPHMSCHMPPSSTNQKAVWS